MNEEGAWMHAPHGEERQQNGAAWEKIEEKKGKEGGNKEGRT